MNNDLSYTMKEFCCKCKRFDTISRPMWLAMEENYGEFSICKMCYEHASDKLNPFGCVVSYPTYFDRIEEE